MSRNRHRTRREAPRYSQGAPIKVQEAGSMLIKRLLPGLTMFVLSACRADGPGSVAGDDTSVARETLISASAPGDEADRGDQRRADVRHVLLISVDGLHQVDAARWIAAHPDSTLAQLADTRRRVHRRPHADAERLVPRPGRAGDRRHAEDDRRLLRRQLRPNAVPAGQRLPGRARHRVHLLRDPRQGLHAALQPDQSREPSAAQGCHGQLHAASSRTSSSRSTRSSRSSARRAATRPGPTSTRPTIW